MIRPQQGIGLPEILISLLLSSLIMSAVVKHYLDAKRQYQSVRTRLEYALDVQSMIDLIRDSSRRAGFTPCLNIDYLVSVGKQQGQPKLRAIDMRSAGESALRINRMSEYYESVFAINSPTELLSSYNQPLNHDYPLLIADCYHAEIQRIKSQRRTEAGQVITLATPLSFTYQPPVYLGEWLEEAFFMRANSPGLLYRLHHTDELSADVNAFSVQMLKEQQGSLLQVTLGLINGQTVQVETKVRTL